jgi:hypothetical protein
VQLDDKAADRLPGTMLSEHIAHFLTSLTTKAGTCSGRVASRTAPPSRLLEHSQRYVQERSGFNNAFPLGTTFALVAQCLRWALYAMNSSTSSGRSYQIAGRKTDSHAARRRAVQQQTAQGRA